MFDGLLWVDGHDMEPNGEHARGIGRCGHWIAVDEAWQRVDGLAMDSAICG